MARNRFGGLRARMVAQRRKTFWFSGIATRTALAAASDAAIQTSLNAAALALRPFTIVRTRGYVYVVSDQVSAIETQDWAYGEIIVSDQAVAVGITAVPTPSADSQSSWHVYERGSTKFEFITGAGFQASTGQFMQFDSKAMRKVEEGQDLIAVIEAAAISSGMTMTTFSRTLIKFH